MRVYKNGKLIGTAFENLLAFLPPASAPSKTMGAREGFDDGVVGYFPAVSCFWGGIAELNFGDGAGGFWCPPAHIATSSRPPGQHGGLAMGQGVGDGAGVRGYEPGRLPRGIGERYKEQIAEDVVWDLVDEVDFYVQDEGKVPVAEPASGVAAVAGLVGNRAAGGVGRVKEEEGL